MYKMLLSRRFSGRLSRRDLRNTEAKMWIHRLRISSHGWRILLKNIIYYLLTCLFIIFLLIMYYLFNYLLFTHFLIDVIYFVFQVEGHCCPYCGGRISTSEKISLVTIRTAADEALEGYKGKVEWHTRHTWNGGVEVLVKEKGDYSGVTIQEAVENLREMLRSQYIITMFL